MACNQKTEVYSRIVGYYRPVQQWNKGKKAEYFARKPYQVTSDKFEDKILQNKAEEEVREIA